MSKGKRARDIASAAVADQPGASVAVIAAEPAPLLLVVSFPADFACPDNETMARIKYGVESAFNGHPHPPVVVLAPGLKLEAVLDPRGPMP